MLVDLPLNLDLPKDFLVFIINILKVFHLEIDFPELVYQIALLLLGIRRACRVLK